MNEKYLWGMIILSALLIFAPGVMAQENSSQGFIPDESGYMPPPPTDEQQIQEVMKEESSIPKENFTQEQKQDFWLTTPDPKSPDYWYNMPD